MSTLVEVGDAARTAAIVGEDLLCHALGAEFAVAGVEGDGNDGILRAILRVDFAGESAAPAAAHAGAATVVGHAVAQHGQMEGMQAEAFCGGLEDAEFTIGRERRHGEIATSWAVEGCAGVIPGDADFVFGFLVERLEIVVGDGPVFERTAGGCAVGGAHPEVLRHVAPGLRAVAQCASTDAGCVVLVGAFAGQNRVRPRHSYRPRRVDCLRLRDRRRCRGRSCAGCGGRLCGNRRGCTTCRAQAGQR